LGGQTDGPVHKPLETINLVIAPNLVVKLLPGVAYDRYTRLALPNSLANSSKLSSRATSFSLVMSFSPSLIRLNVPLLTQPETAWLPTLLMTYTVKIISINTTRAITGQYYARYSSTPYPSLLLADSQG
jgi:hypothetical protein